MIITKTRLLPYQEEAVEKLSKLKVGALFMDMGTGKTRTAIELIKTRLNGGKVDSVLWLHPFSIRSDLEANIKTHSDLIESGKLTMCGIETLSSSVRENLRLLDLVENQKVFLIVDESSLIKNPYALRSKNILRLATKCKYKLILNGTPVTRNEADLFNQFYLLDWRILGYRSYWSFAANHVVCDEKNPERILAIKNTEYLAERIAPYTYECKKEDILKLPSKQYHEVGFYMEEWQLNNYDYVIEELMGQIDEFRPETIYQFFSALQAVISGFHITVKYRNKKPYTIAEYSFENPRDNPRIDCLWYELDKDEKYIIFCNYVKEIEEVATMLNQEKPGSAVMFHGEMREKQRTAALEAFVGKADYFVAHKRCGSYGLNLQFCRNVIYMSHDWDWGTREQSESRVHRIGQNRDVVITDILCNGSLDLKISNCLYKKANLADSFKDELKDKNAMIKFVKGECCEEIPSKKRV
ncbi:DEAD/DEAH box helicase [bacterium 210820-DFI.6.37]|nr:DEAD/DEAH box helicase [bacterium 210820-DFI.6.37]